ncbi:MAG: hypothetical protein NTZ13_00275 [Candidatus Parcubacteria bacterium]|nr:hypothetical protein [Candidatus Parcubacteria bacterium]
MKKAVIAFLRNLADNLEKQDHILIIGRTALFDPAKFIGSGWSIWKGPVDGDGLNGEEQQDQRSLALTEIDFDKISFETCLKSGETYITGEEKLKRHARAGHILADAKIGQVLYEEEGQKKLEYLYKEKGITWFELQGTILRSLSDRRCALYLYRDDGRWDWYYYWLGNGRGADCPSLVLTST